MMMFYLFIILTLRSDATVRLSTLLLINWFQLIFFLLLVCSARRLLESFDPTKGVIGIASGVQHSKESIKLPHCKPSDPKILVSPFVLVDGLLDTEDLRHLVDAMILLIQRVHEHHHNASVRLPSCQDHFTHRLARRAVAKLNVESINASQHAEFLEVNSRWSASSEVWREFLCQWNQSDRKAVPGGTTQSIDEVCKSRELHRVLEPEADSPNPVAMLRNKPCQKLQLVGTRQKCTNVPE